jgi:hypothetical protein
VGKALLAIEALGLETAVPQHLDNLGVLLPVLTEDQLALVVVVLVFATSPIFSTLAGHESPIARNKRWACVPFLYSTKCLR